MTAVTGARVNLPGWFEIKCNRCGRYSESLRYTVDAARNAARKYAHFTFERETGRDLCAECAWLEVELPA